jgi:hypothetical protein
LFFAGHFDPELGFVGFFEDDAHPCGEFSMRA